MFTWVQNMGDVTHAVQLALTPAFLLTGVAGILNVMTNRLARIIDRGRDLSAKQRAGDDSPAIHRELRSLEKRRYAASAAITMCVLSALLVCAVVSVIFLEVLLNFPMKILIGTLFTSSTLALVVGLGYFLKEVHMATRTIRILTAS